MARGLLANAKRTTALGLNMFTEDELWEVHLATLDVMWNVGVKVESARAREIFAGIGCEVNEETRIVKFPAYVVEDAMRVSPPN